MRQHPHILPPIITLPALPNPPAPIILDSPHSGTTFPNYARNHKTRILQQDKNFFQKYADLYIDELIKNTPKLGATTIVAPYARSWIDLNRQPTDILPEQTETQIETQPQIQQEKLSLFWKTAGKCQLWNRLSKPEINRRLKWVWHAYHNALQTHMQNHHKQHGKVLLLNCHSMPSCLTDYHIIIGDNNGKSCDSKIVRYIYDFFCEQGLKVGLNDPFSGGAIISRHSAIEQGFMAVQLELRRDLYMNEENFRKNDNFAIVSGLFDRLVENLQNRMA